VKTTRIIFTIFFSILFFLNSSPCFSSTSLEKSLWLVVHVRDYETDMPIANVSVTATLLTLWGAKSIGPVLTNETGLIKVFLGNVSWKETSATPILNDLSLSGNHVLIKVADLFMEDQQYVSEYIQNLTKYSEMRIPLSQKITEDNIIVQCDLWVLKGKLIKVSSRDPITGEEVVLSVKPAVKSALQSSDYEKYYLFPLNYHVTITQEYAPVSQRIYSPIKVIMEENTTLINWMYYAAREYVEREISRLDAEIKRLSPILSSEIKEFQAIKRLFNLVLYFYWKAEYDPALGGAKIAATRLDDLKKWFSELKMMSFLSLIGVSISAYGFASLLSSLFFTDPSESKKRLAGKITTFTLLMLMFTLTFPFFRVASNIIWEKIIGTYTYNTVLIADILGCFAVGSITYLLFTLISLKETVTDLALQLGMRNLKRRKLRTVLTLITVAIVVSSGIFLVNISLSRTIKMRDLGIGTNTAGVIIQPRIESKKVSFFDKYDVDWIRMQSWCKDIGYKTEIKEIEQVGTTAILRTPLLSLNENFEVVKIVGINAEFMEKYYDLSKYIIGSWKDFSAGEQVALASKSFRVPLNTYVQLAVKEDVVVPGALMPGQPKIIGNFRVVGIFDPEDLSRIPRIDGFPLFSDATNLILVPVGTIRDVTDFSEITIITQEHVDPLEVAKELTYMLELPIIANKDGLSVIVEWSAEFSIKGLIPYLPSLVIAGLMMYTTMFSIHEERKREFITLSILGLDPKNVFWVFLVEALLLGLTGTFIGFFGSYIIGFVLFYLTKLLGIYSSPPTFLFSFTNWSAPSILFALFIGIFMVFMGSCLPAIKTQKLSLLSREKKRRMTGELIIEGEIASFTLPIRTSVQNSDLLFLYIKEILAKSEQRFVNPHSIEGKMYRDGSFEVSFLLLLGSSSFSNMPCKIKGVRKGEILTLITEFPASFIEYGRVKEILRELEKNVIGFSAWKEMQRKMSILRRTPEKRKTMEDIMAEVKELIEQIKNYNRKLKILEAQKRKIPEEIYEEFRQKHLCALEENMKNIRFLATNLEPYYKELSKRLEDLEFKISRITVAYNLGDISEEDYMKICGPLKAKYLALKDKLQEIEKIFDFLNKPSTFQSF